MYVLEEDFAPQTLDNGVIRTIKGHLDNLMVCELVWQKGQEGAVHSHPHTQCDYIIQGRFEANVDGDKRVIGPGECFYVEPNVPHGLIALEDGGVMLDIFTPMRADFLA